MNNNNSQYNSNLNNNGNYSQGYENPGTENRNYAPQYGSAPQTSPKKQKGRFGIGMLVGILVTMALVLLLAVAAVVFFFRPGFAGTAKMNYQEKLSTIQQYLDTFYLGEIDPDKMEDGLAEGMLKGTGDKYAKYYSQKEFSEMMEEMSGAYRGIGVVVVEDKNGILVNEVYEGSPAEEAGVKAGDYIVEAAGTRDFEDLDELVSMVRGEEGTTVDIVLLRDGKEIPVTCERRSITIPTVSFEMLDGNIGYIRLAQFESVSVDQFNEAVDSLEKQGAASLIIDLRDNPGGDYDTAISLTDRVLPAGTITTVINNKGKEKVETSDEEHKITLPMCLLVNGNSASASELFTSAVKDYGIATIIGEKTYGKGIVQSIFRLPDGSGMKFTTEEYLSPKGNKIHEIGITPDIEVSIPEEAYEDGIVTREEDTQLQKAIDVLSKAA
ncbi:MAG: S41 family peptidase [Parasporobacterium sp.]|nr:S41 family peptidase [Parasporobacterium sp.]